MKSRCVGLVLFIFVFLFGIIDVDAIHAESLKTPAHFNKDLDADIQVGETPHPTLEIAPTETPANINKQQDKTPTSIPSSTPIYIPPQLSTKTVRSLIWLAFFIVGLVGLGLWMDRRKDS